MRNVMEKDKNRVRFSELLQELCQRSDAKCEGSKLGLDCTVKLTEDLVPLIHHIDGNPRNNEMSNLVLLCPKCHSEVIDQLAEKRRKTYVRKVAESLDKSGFSRR